MLFEIYLQNMIVRHAPWFIQICGSSLYMIQSRNGKYKYYVAKVAYHPYTQHEGGDRPFYLLKKTYQHWYRVIQHQF